MNKKLVAVVSLLLAFAMLFALSSCSLTKEEETTTETTIAVKTPGLPTEQLYVVADDGETFYVDAEGSTLDETTTLNEAGLQAKNVKLLEYFNINLNALTNGKTTAVVSREDGKSIGKQTDANGDRVSYCEENSKVAAAIDGLRKKMLKTEDYEATEYTNNFADYLPGADVISTLTVADVKSSTCVENLPAGERTVTIMLKSPAAKELIEKNFDMEDLDAVYAEFDKAANYMTIDKAGTTLTYVNCVVTIVTDITTDEVKTVKYSKGINVDTAITGQGTLADVGNVPVHFLYTYDVKYTIDRTDPNAPVEAE